MLAKVITKQEYFLSDGVSIQKLKSMEEVLMLLVVG